MMSSPVLGAGRITKQEEEKMDRMELKLWTWRTVAFFLAVLTFGSGNKAVSAQENLITNPGFEEGNYGPTNCPKGWLIGANDKEWEWSNTVSHNKDGKSVKIGPVNKKYRSMSTDYMISDPGRKYILTGWVKGDNSDETVVCLWIPTFDEKGAFIENWQPPQELRVDIKAGTKWTQFRLPVILKPEVRKIKVQLGLNENNSEGSFSVWFDDVELKEITKEDEITLNGENYRIIKHVENRIAPTISKKSLRRGYVIFSRFDGVYPNSIPMNEEITETLTTFATPGESEPVTFSVYPLKELGKVKIRIDDLIDENGNKIEKDNVDIRTVKCWLQRSTFKDNIKEQKNIPELLLKMENDTAINKRMTKQFWLTVKVPDNAKPGKYQGMVFFETEKGETTRIALNVRILPFKLEKSDLVWGVFYGMAYKMWDNLGLGADRMLEWDYRALKSLGIDFVIPAVNLRGKVFQGTDGKLHINFDRVDKTIEIYKKTGFIEPFILDTGELPGQIRKLIGWTEKTAYYGDLIISDENEVPEKYKEAYKALMLEIDKHAKENNWPAIAYYPTDEPYGQRLRLPGAIVNYKLLKEALPEAKIFCTVDDLPQHQNFAKMLSIACYCAIRCYVEKGELPAGAWEQAKELGLDLWVYTNCAFEENFWRRRIEEGFLFVKSGATRNCPWTHVLDKYSDQHGEAGKAYAMYYYSVIDNSFIPTLQSEGTREAIDDAKYVATLRNIISKAKQSKTKAVAQKAIEMEKSFKEEMDALYIQWPEFSFYPYSDNSDAEDAYNLSNENATRLRWKIAANIIELQKLMDIKEK